MATIDLSKEQFDFVFNALKAVLGRDPTDQEMIEKLRQIFKIKDEITVKIKIVRKP